MNFLQSYKSQMQKSIPKANFENCYSCSHPACVGDLLCCFDYLVIVKEERRKKKKRRGRKETRSGRRGKTNKGYQKRLSIVMGAAEVTCIVRNPRV